MSGYECKPSRKMQEVQLQFSVLDLIKKSLEMPTDSVITNWSLMVANCLSCCLCLWSDVEL